MAGRNPEQAYRNFLRPINEALGCITPQRLSVPRGARRFAVDTDYVFGLPDPGQVAVQGHSRMLFYAGQVFRIVQRPSGDERGPYKVETVRYMYKYMTEDEKDIITFQWTPESKIPGTKLHPHLHMGAIVIRHDSPILPGKFHKTHIPTGRVPLERVVRYGIEELGISPLVEDWDERLTRTEALFLAWKTR